MALFYHSKFTNNFYMKNNKYTQKKSNLSLAGEIINTVIERDIGLVIIIMTAGLLNSNAWGMRGFPFPWLITGFGAHATLRAESFIGSLIAAVIMVIAAEFFTFIRKAGTEPVAARGNSRPSIYANTYDDSDGYDETPEFPDNGAFDHKDTSNYGRALRKNISLNKKAGAVIPSAKSAVKPLLNSSRRPASANNTSGKFVLAVFMIIFFSTVFIILATFAAIMF